MVKQFNKLLVVVLLVLLFLFSPLAEALTQEPDLTLNSELVRRDLLIDNLLWEDYKGQYIGQKTNSPPQIVSLSIDINNKMSEGVGGWVVEINNKKPEQKQIGLFSRNVLNLRESIAKVNDNKEGNEEKDKEKKEAVERKRNEEVSTNNPKVQERKLFLNSILNIDYFSEEIPKLEKEVGGKIDSFIYEQLKDKPPQIEVIIETDELDKLKQAIKSKSVQQKKLADGLLIVTIEAGKAKEMVEGIAKEKGVSKVHANREYNLLLQESIPLMRADTFWESGYTGEGIKIAVLDTGIDSSHPMLENKIVLARSFVEEEPADRNGHGTHIAGIAAGDGDQLKGVAPGAGLINAKVLDRRGTGSTASIIEGINWAVDPDGNPETDDGADIISMSLGAPYETPDELINEALQRAIDLGVVVVLASGNCGPAGSRACGNFEGVTVPGSYKEVITVGAVDNNLEWLGFSSGQNFGDYIKPDVVAPGKDITSSSLNANYEIKSGTSMATPFVAGAAALLLDKDSSLNHYEIKQLLEEKAIDLGEEGKDIRYGSGFVDLGEYAGLDEFQNEDNISDNQSNILILSENGFIEEDFLEYNFLEVREVTYPPESSNSDQLVVYFKGNESVFLERISFNSYTSFANYLYVQIDFSNLNIENHGFNYILFNNRLFWYTNERVVYTTESDINSFNFFDQYSSLTGNVVGDNLQEINVFLRELGRQTYDEHSTNEDEVINESDFNIQYGADSCNEAQDDDFFHLDFGEEEDESYFSQDENNWYYVETTDGTGTIDFRLFDISEGDDLDLQVCDYQCRNCRWSRRGGNAAESLTDTKNVRGIWAYHINVYTDVINGGRATGTIYVGFQQQQCNEGWLDEYQCSGDTRQRRWQNEDCTLEWEDWVDCNDNNWNSAWEYYCQNDDVYKRRTVHDYSCSGGSCRDNSRVESEREDDCGDKEKCSGNSCVPKTCGDYGKTSCQQEGAYRREGNRIDHCEDEWVIGQLLCWNFEANNGADNFCELAREANNPCERNQYDCDNNNECRVNLFCRDDEVTDCEWGEECGCCNNGEAWDKNANTCFTPCRIDSSDWDRRQAQEGEVVTLTASGSGCSGKRATFEIWESDCPGLDLQEMEEGEEEQEAMRRQLEEEGNFSAQNWQDLCPGSHRVRNIDNINFNSNQFRTTWTAVYEEDIVGNPDYYFNVIIDGAERSSSANLLRVFSNAECDNDNDCESNEKCSDEQCVPKTCADYGKTSCNGNGAYQRVGDRVDRCEDEWAVGELLCWNTEARKGDDDFCELAREANNPCERNQYDCDNNNECAGNLYCRDDDATDCEGGEECGCCNNGEAWDERANICYTPCNLNSIRWDRERAVEGEEVTIEVRGPAACSDKQIELELYEDDCYNGLSMEMDENETKEGEGGEFGGQGICDDLVGTLSGRLDAQGDLDMNWEAVYVGDVGGGDSELVILGKYDNGKELESENILVVRRGIYQGTILSAAPLTFEAGAESDVILRVRNEGDEGKLSVEPTGVPQGWTVDDDSIDGDNQISYEMDSGETRDFGFKITPPDRDDRGVVTFNLFWDGWVNHDLDRKSFTFSSIVRCLDNDGDGYGSNNANSCRNRGIDCNDNNRNINPQADEECDGLDNNCDGGADENNICEQPDCGDGLCEAGESCSADCLEIVGFVNPPEQVNTGEGAEISVKFRNKGMVAVNTKSEVGIAPDNWAGEKFSIQAYHDIAGCCLGNVYYDSKLVTLEPDSEQTVRFTVTAPTQDSVDACAEPDSEFLSAWDNSFTLLVGNYEECGAGYTQQKTRNIEVVVPECPNGLDGSSLHCSCDEDTDCAVNQECDLNLGACRGIVAEECEIPDGSSPECDCDRDANCARFGELICEIGPGWDACVGVGGEDECVQIDDYQCKEGDVYRCENIDGRKKLILSDICTFQEVCPDRVAEAQQCVSELNYDLILEQASSGTKVNKQPGDTLRIKVKSDREVALDFDYDENAFELLSGNCEGGDFQAGDNICEFAVSGEIGEYSFTVGEDTEVVRIINMPYVLYVTNVPQLYQRFNDNIGVEVLLAKTYERAAQNLGIVYDLDREIGVGHPFAGGFGGYAEILVPRLARDNAYALEAGNFVNNHCNGCKETILIGDDFVVPSYMRTINEYDSSWLFWGDSFTQGIYTDIAYAQRETLLLSDFDEVFKINGEFAGKNILFIVPEDTSEEMDDEIRNLQRVLENRNYNPDFELITSDDVNCRDDRWFLEWEGKTLIVIGTEENNNALKCYPFTSAESNSNTAFMERNLWDRDEYAVIINTNNEKVVKAFAEIINSGEYIDLKSESAYFFDVSVDVVSYTAMGVGVLVILGGTGGTAAPFLIAGGAILEGVADSSDVVNTCKINPDGMGWCGASIGFAVMPFVPGKQVKNVLKKAGDTDLVQDMVRKLEPFHNIIEDNFKNLKNYFGANLWRTLTATTEDNIYMARGVRRLFGENVEDVGRDLPRKVPFVNKQDQGEIIKAIGKAENSFGISEEMVRKVSFVSSREINGAEGYYDLANKEIMISRNINPERAIKNVMNHEYSHAFVTEKLGKELWEFVPDNLANNPQAKAELATHFNEFLAESSAKRLIPNHVIAPVIDRTDNVIDIKAAMLDPDTRDQAAYMLAIIKQDDLLKYNQIKDELIRLRVDKIDETINLVGEFEDASRMLSENQLSAEKIEQVLIKINGVKQ